ncbi:calcium-binding protein, partial [Pseudovibrio denitrificans]|uniref:calcium-binding protein n=1 Tax=Pseudovibrio denitrificans TaxID=258256 RepID=UPI00244EADBC
MKGTAATDVIHGLAGNDKLYGYAGNDKLYGGEGNDYFWGDAGADLIDGGPGVDFARYGASNVAVHINLSTGTASGGYAQGDVLLNIESLEGSNFDDVLIGDDRSNGLYALSGKDRLEGKGGNDTLNAYGSGADILDGGEGSDVARYYYAKSGVTVNLADPSQNKGDAKGDTYISIERIMGTRDHADTLIGDAGNNTLYGYGGDDILNGGAGSDALYGGAGADQLIGGTGGGDSARYTASPAGVSVNLTTGAVSGGYAEGDTLSGIEYVEG